MKDKVHILIIEDEKNISDILKFNLEKESYDISQRFDGKEGLEFALSNEIDLRFVNKLEKLRTHL